MVVINHNYPHDGDLRVVDVRNEPIEGAVIRVFTAVQFDAGDLTNWVGATTTDVNGEWIDPIMLEDGNSWVVYIEKPTVAGPSHVEIFT